MVRHVARPSPYPGSSDSSDPNSDFPLTSDQFDRAYGLMLGSAAGDLITGSCLNWAHSDATRIARAAAAGMDVCTRATQRELLANWQATPASLLSVLSPLALAYLDDEDRLISAATMLGTQVGVGRRWVKAGMVWTRTLRQAVLTGEVQPSIGLASITDADDAVRWLTFLETLDDRWQDPFVDACASADTCGPLAGALAGARWGASAIPVELQRQARVAYHDQHGDLLDLTMQILGVAPTGRLVRG